MNPPAVISLPHPHPYLLSTPFFSFLLRGLILPPLSRTTIGKLSEAELIIIRYLLFFFFTPTPLVWGENKRGRYRRIQEDSGMEKWRVRSEVDRREVYHGRQKQTAPCCQPGCPICLGCWHFPLASAQF